MKIYTRTGDDGTTALFGGGRVPKDHIRVEAYGTVDELNCHLGVVRSLNRDPDVDAALSHVQSELFALGADLATPAGTKAESRVRRIAAEDGAWLERMIDQFDGEIAQLQSFILPGGHPVAAAVHLARAVCRRAERAVVALSRTEPVGAANVIFLNRLSDFLFTLGRAVNRRAGVAEEPWTPRT